MTASVFPYGRALVTGAAGFIGSHIVEALLDRGVEVVALDDYSSGKRENLAPFVGHPGFRAITADVTDERALASAMQGVGVVFHNAASKKNVCLKDPRRDLDVNAKGAYNVFALACERGVRKVVHASTGSVYGEGVQFPQGEDHPLAPVSYYGVSKLAGERYGGVFGRLYGLDVTVLRYFHVYGPRQEWSDYGGVVSIFIRRILNGEPPVIFGDGTQQRSFTYVEDVVRANLHVAVDERARGQVYNCASGLRITVGELARKLLRLFRREDLAPRFADWLPGDIRIFDVDNRRLRALGWGSQTGFDEGLLATAQWYRSYFDRDDLQLNEERADYAHT
jgi:nucleoside-diphosphate-sugar epimerase